MCCYRIYRHANVSIRWENVDREKLKQTLGGSAASAARSADSVIDPIEVFVAIEGRR